MTASAAVKDKPDAAAGASAGDPCMRCTVNRTGLLHALGFAAGIVDRRNTIPVLANVLLEAEGGELRVTATDLNLQLALTVPCEVEAGGAITVQAALLHNIVREFADGSQVELKLADGRLQVNSGRSRYKLQTIPRDDFPVVQPGKPVAEFSLPAADLLKAFYQVEFAQSTETVVRAYLCGVHIDVEDGELTFAASDGNRLAWSKLPAPDGAALSGMILSAKMVTSIIRLLDGRDDEATLTFEERKAVFRAGDAILSGKLVEGTYPPWRRVIPAANDKQLLVEAKSFEGALRRASLIASERTRVVKIELTTNKLTLSATSQQHGVAVEEVPCAWSGGDLTIGFNSRFLLDVLAAGSGDELQVDLFDEVVPGLFSNPADDSARWIVPPMRV